MKNPLFRIIILIGIVCATTVTVGFGLYIIFKNTPFAANYIFKPAGHIWHAIITSEAFKIAAWSLLGIVAIATIGLILFIKLVERETRLD